MLTLCSKRLLALAAQKFISDIAQDAYQHSKIRASNAGGNAGAGGAPNAPRGKYGKERARVVLSMDDLGMVHPAMRTSVR